MQKRRISFLALGAIFVMVCAVLPFDDAAYAAEGGGLGCRAAFELCWDLCTTNECKLECADAYVNCALLAD